jgi:hypothetical protein
MLKNQLTKAENATNRKTFFESLAIATEQEEDKKKKHKSSSSEDDDGASDDDNSSVDLLVGKKAPVRKPQKKLTAPRQPARIRKNPDLELSDLDDESTADVPDKGYEHIEKIPKERFVNAEKVGLVLFETETHSYYIDEEEMTGMYQHVDLSGSKMVENYDSSFGFNKIYWEKSLRRDAADFLLNHFANVATGKKIDGCQITNSTKEYYKYRCLSFGEMISKTRSNPADCFEPRSMAEIENYLVPREPGEQEPKLPFNEAMFGILECIQNFATEEKIKTRCDKYYQWHKEMYTTFKARIDECVMKKEEELALRKEMSVEALREAYTEAQIRQILAIETITGQSAETGTRIHSVVENAMKSVTRDDWFFYKNEEAIARISKKMTESLRKQQLDHAEQHCFKLLIKEEEDNLVAWFKCFFKWLLDNDYVCFCVDLAEKPFARRKYMTGGKMDFIFIRRVMDEGTGKTRYEFVAMDLKCGQSAFNEVVAPKGGFRMRKVKMGKLEIPMYRPVFLPENSEMVYAKKAIGYAFQLGTYRRTLQNKNREFLNIGQQSPLTVLKPNDEIKTPEEWKHVDLSRLRWSTIAYNIIIHPSWKAFNVIEYDLVKMKARFPASNFPGASLYLPLVKHVDQAFAHRLKSLLDCEKQKQTASENTESTDAKADETTDEMVQKD